MSADHQSAARPLPARENEFYGGYSSADLERIERVLACPAAPTPGFITDFIGVRTSPEYLPYAAHLAGNVVANLPVPDDSLHAETIEYAALARVVESMRDDRFRMFELGAGWGPWLSAAGVLARRRGVREIHLVGVEADPGRFVFLQRHLAENGLRPAGDAPSSVVADVRCDLFNGAAWWQPTVMYFPQVDSANDHGGAATTHSAGADYRGLALEHRPVQAYALADLVRRFGPVDFVHVDIQGGEYELLSRSMEVLRGSVRFLFVGTHSRKIEGDLIALLLANNFRLLNEKPCRFDPETPRPTLEGMTTRDGSQFWSNEMLA